MFLVCIKIQWEMIGVLIGQSNHLSFTRGFEVEQVNSSKGIEKAVGLHLKVLSFLDTTFRGH